MIPVKKVRKPRGFDKAVKAPGAAWLTTNANAKRPKALWSPYLPGLASGFGNLCGYAAMLDPTGGTVDHYLSFKNHPHLAYEWSNYRFASAGMNQSKGTQDAKVLDPFAVGPEWFEIILPSLQMRVTSLVPANEQARATHTLKRLKLAHGEKVLRWREHWYCLFESGQLTLGGLRKVAPLIADAVVRQQAGKPQPVLSASTCAKHLAGPPTLVPKPRLAKKA